MIKHRARAEKSLAKLVPEVIYNEKTEPHLHAVRHVDVTWIVVKLP